MTDITIQIENCLAQNFGYQRGTDYRQFVLDNMSYKMLAPAIEDKLYDDDTDVSIFRIMLDYEWVPCSKLKAYREEVRGMIPSLTSEQIKELGGSAAAHEALLLELNHFLEFPSMGSIIDFEYSEGWDGYGVVSGSLKDPFYTFPEIEGIRAIKEVFGVSAAFVSKTLAEEIYEYIRGEFDDTWEREEMELYWEKCLNPHILSGKKDFVVVEMVSELEGLISIIDRVEDELEILSLAFSNPECPPAAKSRIQSKRSSALSPLRDIPTKYCQVGELVSDSDSFPLTRLNIEAEIERLLASQGGEK